MKPRSANLGAVNVLLVSVSVPANVAKVPVVGSVTFVVAVDVRVVAKAPAVISELPSISVRVALVVGAVIVTTWQHIAVVRSGFGANNLVVYVNGVNQGQATNSTAFVGLAANGFALGAEYAGSFFPSFNGYIDDLRITKGVARYTANFTPPTLPFPDF